MRRLSPLIIVVCSLTAFIVQPVLGQGGRSPAKARNGMVVSSNYLASNVGISIMEKGGNAVDAAIGISFALAVVYPTAGNIGGGGFMVYHGADGHKTSFNYREKAPLAASATMYLDEYGAVKDNANHEGILSVGVPGSVAGLWLAHQRLGKLPWKELVQPAVDLAKDGFPFSWAMEGISGRIIKMAAADDLYAGTAKSFLKNANTAYTAGETIKQPDLAKTLERIRDQGKDGFYGGKTASIIARYMREHGGLITEEDLARYEAEELIPIHGTYRGYDVYGMPPPSSGGVTLVQMLNILEGFDLSSMGLNSATYMHVVTEAMRRGYANRAEHIGDPNFNPDIPTDRLISKEYARDLRKSISLNTASVSDSNRFAAAFAYNESEETTHFSVMDGAGNAVSVTTTLEYGYGSKIVVDGAGFLLNNEMGDFNARPGYTDSRGTVGTVPNQIAPEKRMLSSMTPTILALDGRPVMVVGTVGGRTIINLVLQVILNVIDHKLNIAVAVESPRFHHQWLPDRTRIQRDGFSQDSIRLYEMMGHDFYFSGPWGGVNAIIYDAEEGVMYGGADSRGFDSKAVGY
jgi:gamma-glutamyltranspeptidase / glutathione hydrolase